MVRFSYLPTFVSRMIPSMLGLLALTSASLVDGLFIGQWVGPEALAMTLMLVPYLTFHFAIALMMSIGGAVTASSLLGKGKVSVASNLFFWTLITGLVVFTLTASLSFWFESSLFSLLSIPPEVQPIAQEYFSIIRWSLVLQLMTMILYYFIRVDEFYALASKALLAGAFSNILLDALFIGHFSMGVRGAALATLAAMVIQSAFLLSYFLCKRKSFRTLLPCAPIKLMRQSLWNGFSECMNECCAGLLIGLINFLTLRYLGVEGVAAYAAVNYLIFMSLMMSYGLADALHPSVSRSFGEGATEAIRGYTESAVLCALVLGGTISLFLLTFGGGWASIFIDEKNAAALQSAQEITLIIWPLFLVQPLNITLGCYLTAIHQPAQSALLSACRSLIFPAALLLSLSHWQSDVPFMAALPLAEWLTLLTGAWLFYQYRPSKVHQNARHETMLNPAKRTLC